MEHTIKSTKNLITSMGANKTEKAVLRSSMAVTGVSESLHASDESPNVKPPSTAHTKKSADTYIHTYLHTSFEQLPV